MTLLRECISLEAEAIPLYTRHLETPEFFEGVSSEDTERAKKALQRLAEDATSHKRIFELLLTKVQDASKDVH